MMKAKVKSLEEAIESLQNVAQGFSQDTEILPLLDAQEKFLAEAVFAKKALPCFDNAAMDGYALKASNAGKTLKIKTSIFAGDCTEVSLEGLECAKIMTGAKIPSGADCVVPFEEIEGGFQNAKQINVPQTLKQGANIRGYGEEVALDSMLLGKGTHLSADSLALLATQGISHLQVFAPLRISVFASGNELKEIWEEADSYHIYNSNATMIQAILKSYGFQSRYNGILQDNRDSIQAVLECPSDVVFTSGGASQGEADFIRETLEKSGAQMVLNGVQIKPGKPLMVAKLGEKFIVALPGNPLAGAVLLRLLLVPFLRELSGASAYYPQPLIFKSTQNLVRKNRTEIMLGIVQGDSISFTKGGKYSSSEVIPMSLSNALIVFSKSRDSIMKGEALKVLPFKMDFGSQKIEFIN